MDPSCIRVSGDDKIKFEYQLTCQFDTYHDQPVVVSKVLEKAERPAKELFYIPALLLLALVFFMQRRRIQVT